MKRNWQIVILMIVLVLAVSLASPIFLSSYVTGYEGAKGRYAGIWDDNKEYTNFNTHGATTCRFTGTTFAFDPDEPKSGMPNLNGEMGAIQFPYGVAQTPYKEYRWEIENEDDTVSIFRMELWILEWYIHVASDAANEWPFNERMNRYTNTEVWFKINLEPTWYFEDQPNEVYFGIAAIELKEFRVVTGDEDLVEVWPEASGSLLTIYDSLFGVYEEPKTPEEQFYSYQGKRLNSQYFRPSVYTLIRLADFGPEPYNLGWNVVEESVRWQFTVHTFVIGEWKVPKEYAEEPGVHHGQIIRSGLEKLWLGLVNWFGNPWNAALFLIAMVIVAIVIIFIILAAVGAIPILLGAYLGGRRK